MIFRYLWSVNTNTLTFMTNKICVSLSTYWLGMSIIALFMSPLYQLLSEATLKTIVGTEGTIKVLLCSYPVNKCFIKLNFISLEFKLNDVICKSSDFFIARAKLPRRQTTRQREADLLRLKAMIFWKLLMIRMRRLTSTFII
jgi:hypothetical protein